ncbi:LysR family transcriptional regulator [Amycolatopsis anabasis]|uniref:LysR family transcriptional regulator n=1 Tax=Amycolatopsis anabasis TaxID=1840409 RepID=UPI001FE8B1FB|nr:LysR family transcriptional regulator [Amycolatopsis anabasis]
MSYRWGSGVERRDLEIFLTLAAQLHFGRTADELHVSQARVSQTIKKLERQIGAPLFERTSRCVELTPIGRRLRDDLEPAVRRIQEGIDRAVTAARGVGGVLGVAFQAPPVADLVSGLLEEFSDRLPDCAVQVREADFADPFALLRDGEVDVLATLFPIDEPGLTTGPVVFTEPLVLAVSARHPFARKKSVSLEDLARDTVFRAAWPSTGWDDSFRTPKGSPVPRGRAVATVQELFAAISASEGVCPVAAHAADYFARPNIVYVPIRDAPPAEWGLVWRTAGETGRLRAFVEAAREFARG